MPIIKIEFYRLYGGATFFDPKTNLKWVKFDDDGAVIENSCHDSIGAFRPDEIVWIL